ncbi:MAG: hypothetical protein CVU89_11390 [Firmicutes bacterium HGW-Firmicutes-14]|nr:MAG: hypothetical protein CVU89_11390 [Firmicutes bacterium HGW-Firmicutes-14]
MCRKRFMILISIIFIFNAACSPLSNQNNLRKTSQVKSPVSIFIKLADEQGFVEKTQKNLCYFLEKNFLKGNLEIKATNEKPIKIQLITLLDYKPFKTMPLIVFPNKTNVVPFEITVKEDGIHDLVFLAIIAPQQHSYNTDFRYSSSSLVMALRTNIVKNAGETSQTPYSLRGDVTIANSDLPPLSLSKSKPSENKKIWIKEEVNDNEQLAFWINLNNKSIENSYAVLVFLDNEQVPVFNKHKDVVGYISAEKNTMISIPVNLPEPMKKGVHELFSIAVPNPFIPLIDNQGKTIQRDIFIRPSLRVGINVL